MSKRISTAVFSARVHHQDLATIFRYYRSIGTKIDSVSGLIRMATEDFAKVLITNGKSVPPSLEDAISELSVLRGQTSHANKLRKTTAEQLLMEGDNQTVFNESVSDEDLDAIVASTLKNSTKGDED